MFYRCCTVLTGFLAAQIALLGFQPFMPASIYTDRQDAALGSPASVNPSKPAVTAELRGDILMARKMYREAIEIYTQDPDQSHVVLNKIGIAYHQMLQIDTAKKYYEMSVKLEPKYAEAINNIGTVLYSKRSYRRAIGMYKRALRLEPTSASIESNLGTAFFARKNYKEALDAYQKALALDPEVFDHHNATGVLLQERTVEDRATYHFYMAKTYARAGMNERALIYVRKCLEEGFTERRKFTREPDFAGLKKMPEFQELMASEPRVL